LGAFGADKSGGNGGHGNGGHGGSGSNGEVRIIITYLEQL
jgi:hypothetical protein